MRQLTKLMPIQWATRAIAFLIPMLICTAIFQFHINDHPMFLVSVKCLLILATWGAVLIAVLKRHGYWSKPAIKEQ